MTGPATTNLARTMAAERAADTERRAHLARLLAESGADHPVRRRFSISLINLGLRLAPQPMELVPAPRPATDS